MFTYYIQVYKINYCEFSVVQQLSNNRKLTSNRYSVKWHIENSNNYIILPVLMMISSIGRIEYPHLPVGPLAVTVGALEEITGIVWREHPSTPSSRFPCIHCGCTWRNHWCWQIEYPHLPVAPPTSTMGAPREITGTGWRDDPSTLSSRSPRSCRGCTWRNHWHWLER